MDIAKILENPFGDMAPEKKASLMKVLTIVGYVAAGVFALLALRDFISWIVSLVNYGGYGFFYFLRVVITIGAYVMLGLSIFLNKKLFALIGFGGMAISELFAFITSAQYTPDLEYGVMNFLSDLVYSVQCVFLFFGFAAAAFVVLVILNLIKPLEKLQPMVKKFWIAPVVFFVVFLIFDFFLNIYYMVEGGLSFASIMSILFMFSMLVSATYALFVAVNPYGILAEEAQNQFSAGVSGASPKNVDVAEDSIYCNLTSHILLLIFTCGVWMYMWIFKTTRRLNDRIKEGEHSPIAQLFLCMFVPFYSIFWVNRSAHRIDTLAKEKGVDSAPIGTLCLLLSIFTSAFVPAIIMQIKMNNIAKSTGEVVVSEAPASAQEAPVAAPVHTEPRTAPQTVAPLSNADELKKYKELLDMGAITEDEYNAKKKQLLGL